MRSISARLTIAIVAMGIISSILMGFIAQILIEREFNQLAQERIFEQIKTDVSAYTAIHGSWEQARTRESFGQFRRSRNQNIESNPGFLLIDAEGTIVMGSGTYRVGETVPADLLGKGYPIRSNGQVVATVVAVGDAVSDLWGSRYWAAVASSLKLAASIVVALVFIVGVLLGRRIVAPLRKLADSITTELQGKQYQNFELDSKNEVELLDQYSKHLCGELDRARSLVRQSRKTISDQAAKLAEISIRDEITQLYNHHYFNERGLQLFARSQRSGEPFSCVIAEIDRFKQINDKFSREVGNKVLKKMAELLRSSTRETDIVARYDGGKFEIAFSDTPLELAQMLCERLSVLVQGCNWAEIHPSLSVKLRIGLCADMGLDGFEQMVAVADAKLYLSKDGVRVKVKDAQLATG